jgi:hypothetical protein
MRLIEESGFDTHTKACLALACEATLREIVRDKPRQAWNARLLTQIQTAVLDLAGTGERDHERLVGFATRNAQHLVQAPPARRNEANAAAARRS